MIKVFPLASLTFLEIEKKPLHISLKFNEIILHHNHKELGVRNTL